jgi:hypothetical protein
MEETKLHDIFLAAFSNPLSMLCFGFHIHLFHYVFLLHCHKIWFVVRCTSQNRQSGMSVFSIMCLWVTLVYYLFLPTQVDRVVLPAYWCLPMFHVVFTSSPYFLSGIELLFFHPFHQVLISSFKHLSLPGLPLHSQWFRRGWGPISVLCGFLSYLVTSDIPRFRVSGPSVSRCC